MHLTAIPLPSSVSSGEVRCGADHHVEEGASLCSFEASLPALHRGDAFFYSSLKIEVTK